ncbi:MAG: protein kinase [Vicinamibacterales bacterium]
MHPGFLIGQYEITEMIGEGGMGAVYRARDTRLHRDVAIKVVQPLFAADDERLVRFEREARVLASLSHPHIATIHGLEEQNGVRFLVMELVPGTTLAARLAQGPMTVAEAVAAALQIAAAIEAAHERGVIHRDLKPGNIMLAASGTVKVLDFGLAKALDSEGAVDPARATRTLSATGAGTVLGTAAYMSPEQSRGSAVDRRTDVWAFGCVFYEMLTARRVFAARTHSDLLVAVLTLEPDWSALPAGLPPALPRLLRRCLEKDVTRRLRDMGDARLELEEASSASSEARRLPAALFEPTPSASRAGWIAGAVTLAVFAGVAGWTLKPERPSPRTAAQFTVPLPATDRLSGTDFPAVAISAGDTHIAFIASRDGHSQLFIRPLQSLDATPVPGTDGALSPFFSPDGQWIAFFTSGKLKRVPVGGGPVRTIADAAIGFGGVWGADGNIIFAPNNGSALLQVSANGGETRQVTTLDAARGEFSHRWPELMPDGQTVLYAVGTEGSWDDAQIVAQPITGGERRVLIEGGTYPRYLPDGRLLYARGGALFAVPLDAAARVGAGEPQRVMPSVLQSSDGASQFSVTMAGGIIYVPGVQNERRLVWVDHTGAVQPLAVPRGFYSSPRLSPDGRSVAVVSGRDRDEIWVADTGDASLRQLTHDGGAAPVWSADGTRIVFSASRDGPAAVFSKAANGSGGDERLTTGTHAQSAHSASPDGQLLAVVEQKSSGGRDIVLLSLAGDHGVRPFRSTAETESSPVFSPDARFIAYVSDGSGQNEVYVSATNGSGTAVRVSTDGGAEPRWHPDGAQLFFRSATRMMVAKVVTSPSLSASAQRVLFEGGFVRGSGSSAEYDVSPDGARFLMLEGGDDTESIRELRVILGWIRETARR